MAHFTRSFLPVSTSIESDPTIPAHVKTIPAPIGVPGRALVTNPPGWNYVDFAAPPLAGSGLTSSQNAFNLGGNFLQDVILNGGNGTTFRVETNSLTQSRNLLLLSSLEIRLQNQLFSGQNLKSIVMRSDQNFISVLGRLKYENNQSFTDPTHIVDKQYVDNISALAAGGLAFKNPVRVASTTNLNLFSISLPVFVDGISINIGDSVLIKNQVLAHQNGIYTLLMGMGLIFNRRADANAAGPNGIRSNILVFVEQGIINADKAFLLRTDGPIALGSTPLEFVEFGVSVTVNETDPTIPNHVKQIPEPFSPGLKMLVGENGNWDLRNYIGQPDWVGLTPNPFSIGSPGLLRFNGNGTQQGNPLLSWVQESDPTVPNFVKQIPSPNNQNNGFALVSRSGAYALEELDNSQAVNKFFQVAAAGGSDANSAVSLVFGIPPVVVTEIYYTISGDFFDFLAADLGPRAPGTKIFVLNQGPANGFVNGIILPVGEVFIYVFFTATTMYLNQ
jgi:hypothetical protein